MDIVEGLVAPLRALVLAVSGCWLAWSWTDEFRVVPVFVIVALMAAGLLCERAGRALLPERPVSAVIAMEFWILVPMSLGVIASAAIIGLAMRFALPASAPAAEQEIMKSLSAALGAFLTAGFIAWSSDKNESPVARRVQRAFFDAYGRYQQGQHSVKGVKYFAADSDGERWVFSEAVGGIEGWGHEARLRRARGIAEEIRNRTSDPRT